MPGYIPYRKINEEGDLQKIELIAYYDEDGNNIKETYATKGEVSSSNDDIEKAIERANAAANSANTAAGNANTAANTANTAASNIETLEEEITTAESGRVSAENARKTAETARQTAETNRASAFTSAQNARQQAYEDAEAERDEAFNSAEAQRNSSVNAAISNANSAATKANNAATSANEAADNANEAAETAATVADSANTKATNALAKATTAETNASNAVSTANSAKTIAEQAKTAADSAVKEIATGITNGNISVDGKDVPVKGLGSAAFTNSGNYATSVHTHEIDEVTGLQDALDGKAASSHGTHVTWSTTTPKANGTATVGTETKVARGDHVHPAQTSVSGNAGTATKLATARTITLSGDVSGSASFDGSDNITITATVADDSHNHTIANVDGLQSALDAKEASGSAATALTNAKSYTDTKISELINSAPTTLDTLGEIATAMAENADVVSALEEAIGTKANANHNHSGVYLPDSTTYAGSSTKGGAATSANKVNNSIAIKLNGGTTEGTNLFTFDGSTPKTINITPASIGAATSGHNHDSVYSKTSHTHSYLPLSGGALDDGAEITLQKFGQRKVILTGNDITFDMSDVSGGWAGNFAAIKDPAGTTIPMIGVYGGDSGLTHIFMGGSYSDPYMKMTKAGTFTFKNDINVGSNKVALAINAAPPSEDNEDGIAGLMSATDKAKLDNISATYVNGVLRLTI